MTPTILPESSWRFAAATHEARLGPTLDAVLERRRAGRKEPVTDFLFEYYSFRPARLRAWSPGVGVCLEGAAREDVPSYVSYCAFDDDGATIDPTSFPERRLRGLRWILDLLRQTASRPGYFGCYGMHEWAMVYKAADVRHRHIPLRLDPDALAAFVEARPVSCTHYDAFRFFTPPARPLNRHQLSPDDAPDFDQPGCVHANMDLYKWSYKLWPYTCSDLIAETFELAIRARTLDMRASPYDLSAQGLEPIPIETTEGRLAYQVAQKAIAVEAEVVRGRVIEAYEVVIAAVER